MELDIEEIIKLLRGESKINSQENSKSNLEEMDSMLLLHEIIHSKLQTCEEPTFSTDYDKYNEQLKDFIDYIVLAKEILDVTCISVTRDGNVIRYGRLNHGIPVDRHEIIMTNDNNLKEIYDTLKEYFLGSFVPGWEHEFCGGYSLLPVVFDKIMIKISSQEEADANWIYEEVHSKPTIIDVEISEQKSSSLN